MVERDIGFGDGGPRVMKSAKGPGKMILTLEGQGRYLRIETEGVMLLNKFPVDTINGLTEDLSESFQCIIGWWRNSGVLPYFGDEPETLHWLAPEEVTILDAAIDLGYYETPKRITLNELAEELDFNNPTILSVKLGDINKKVTQRFIKTMLTPLVAPEPEKKE